MGLLNATTARCGSRRGRRDYTSLFFPQVRFGWRDFGASAQRRYVAAIWRDSGAQTRARDDSAGRATLPYAFPSYNRPSRALAPLPNGR